MGRWGGGGGGGAVVATVVNQFLFALFAIWELGSNESLKEDEYLGSILLFQYGGGRKSMKKAKRKRLTIMVKSICNGNGMGIRTFLLQQTTLLWLQNITSIEQKQKKSCGVRLQNYGTIDMK